jgi:Domain of unknown function (DUF4389)
MTTDQLPVAQPMGIGARILYSILFGLVFWLLCWALAITTIGQLVLVLVTRAPSTDLTRFGRGLARYAGQLIEFLSCANDKLPFPFSDWPDMATPIKREDFEQL